MNFCIKFISIFVCFMLACLLKHVRSECYQPPPEELLTSEEESTIEFLCPIDYAEIGGFKISVNSRNDVKIDCVEIPFFDSVMLPIIPLYAVNLLQIRDCRVLPESGFKSVINKFSVFENTSILIALDLQNNYIETLRPNLFQNLTFLKDLNLSINQIDYFPPGLFQSLQELKNLNLYINKIRTLNDTTFDGLDRLESLDLSFNEIEFISKYAFKNLLYLTQISLSGNRLTSISEDVFKTNTNLKSISLNYNINIQLDEYIFFHYRFLEELDLPDCNLKEVPRGFAKSLTYLEKIDVSRNRLENLDNIVANIRYLKVLLAEDNAIAAIDENTFSGLLNLEKLNLARNKIGVIHPQAFSNNYARLTVLNLSKNLYSGGGGLFKELVSLVDLNLSDNLITQIEDLSLKNTPHLETLNLRRNIINNISLSSFQTYSSVDVYLEFNNISIVNFHDVDGMDGSHTANICLDYNPIRCDCKNYDLFKSVNGLFLKPMTMFNFSPDLTCAAPTTLAKKPVREVKLSAVNCPLEQIAENKTGCPEECYCNWRPFDTSIVVNCANKNLTKLPTLVESELKWINYTDIEFNLSNNNLVSVNLTGLKNITKLFLDHNSLSELSGLPKGLKVLTLDHNNLSRLSSTNLQNLKRSHLVNLTLGCNPWICTCDTANFSYFVRRNVKIVDHRDIYCINTTTRPGNLINLCHDVIVVLLPLITISLVLIATVLKKFNQNCELFNQHNLFITSTK